MQILEKSTSAQRPSTGVLLVNVGTPDTPAPSAVRRYLREFLSDPRVIDIAPLARWLLLNLIILPLRPRRSARAYQKIWTDEGSPLLVQSQRFADALQAKLGDHYSVRLAMRYGAPSLSEALVAFEHAHIDRFIVFPLFPQYASATSGTIFEAIYRWLSTRTVMPAVHSIHQFYESEDFIQAWATLLHPLIETHAPDCLLLSYHGLPVRQVKKSHQGEVVCPFAEAEPCPIPAGTHRQCYRAQCYHTSALIQQALNQPTLKIQTSFQSRLGKDPWIQPYTDDILEALYTQGVRRLMMATPAFVADCLETLEEIGMEARARWLELGGETFTLAPCLNDHPAWVQAAANMVDAHTSSPHILNARS